MLVCGFLVLWGCFKLFCWVLIFGVGGVSFVVALGLIDLGLL